MSACFLSPSLRLPRCPLPRLTTWTVSPLRNFTRPSARSHLAPAAAANSAEFRAAEKPRFSRTLARRFLGVRRQIWAHPGRCLPDPPPPGPAHPCLPNLSQVQPIALLPSAPHPPSWIPPRSFRVAYALCTLDFGNRSQVFGWNIKDRGKQNFLRNYRFFRFTNRNPSIWILRWLSGKEAAYHRIPWRRK